METELSRITWDDLIILDCLDPFLYQFPVWRNGFRKSLPSSFSSLKLIPNLQSATQVFVKMLKDGVLWIRYLTGVWTWAEVLKYSYYLEHLYSWFQKVGILMTHPKRQLEFFVFKLAFEPSGWINVIVKPSLIYLPYKRE